MRDKFMFFDNFKETADKLPDDLRLKFYDAMTDYVFKDIEPDDAVISALISAIKPALNTETWGGAREGAGRKPTKNNNLNQDKIKINQDELEKLENNQDEIKFNQDNQDEQKEKKSPLNPKENKNILPPDNNKLLSSPKKFSKPSVDEVKSYCLERKNGVDAERFVDFYECKGWKVGKNPMKDWRAAVRNWERMEEGRQVIPAANDIITRSAEDEERSKRMMSVVEATKAKIQADVIARFGV